MNGCRGEGNVIKLSWSNVVCLISFSVAFTRWSEEVLLMPSLEGIDLVTILTSLLLLVLASWMIALIWHMALVLWDSAMFAIQVDSRGKIKDKSSLCLQQEHKRQTRGEDRDKILWLCFQLPFGPKWEISSFSKGNSKHLPQYYCSLFQNTNTDSLPEQSFITPFLRLPWVFKEYSWENKFASAKST